MNARRVGAASLPVIAALLIPIHARAQRPERIEIVNQLDRDVLLMGER